MSKVMSKELVLVAPVMCDMPLDTLRWHDRFAKLEADTAYWQNKPYAEQWYLDRRWQMINDALIEQLGYAEWERFEDASA